MELNEVSKHKAENLSRKPQQKVIKELSEATVDVEKSTERKCSSQIRNICMCFHILYIL